MTPLLLALSLLMAGAHTAKPMSAAEVARRLDVTTFANSTGPARRPGARTLRDYGFTKVELAEEGGVLLYQANSTWSFSIYVLSWSGRKGILCIGDMAMISGTYAVIKPLEVEEGPNGLLRATGRSVTHPDCEEFLR